METETVRVVRIVGFPAYYEKLGGFRQRLSRRGRIEADADVEC